MLLVTDAAGSAAGPAAGSVAPPVPTAAQAVDAHLTVAAGEESATSAAPGDGSLPLTTVNVEIYPHNQDGGASGTTAAPIVRGEVAATAEVPDDSHNVKLVVVSSCLYHVQMVLLYLLTFRHLELQH